MYIKGFCAKRIKTICIQSQKLWKNFEKSEGVTKAAFGKSWVLINTQRLFKVCTYAISKAVKINFTRNNNQILYLLPTSKFLQSTRVWWPKKRQLTSTTGIKHIVLKKQTNQVGIQKGGRMFIHVFYVLSLGFCLHFSFHFKAFFEIFFRSIPIH